MSCTNCYESAISVKATWPSNAGLDGDTIVDIFPAGTFMDILDWESLAGTEHMVIALSNSPALQSFLAEGVYNVINERGCTCQITLHA